MVAAAGWAYRIDFRAHRTNKKIEWLFTIVTVIRINRHRSSLRRLHVVNMQDAETFCGNRVLYHSFSIGK
jgi:hypothetical protein